MHVLHSHLPIKTTQMTTAYESLSQLTALSTTPTTLHLHPTLSGVAGAFVSINVSSVHPFQLVSTPRSSGGPDIGRYAAFIAIGGIFGCLMLLICLLRICLWHLRRKKRAQVPIGGRQQAGTNQNEAPQMEEPEPIRLAPRRREHLVDDEIEEQGERIQVEGYDASPIVELGGSPTGSNLRLPINPNENRVLLPDLRINVRPPSVMSGQTLVAVRGVPNAGERLTLTILSRSPNPLQDLIIS
jgi:hypothetical protein